MVIYDRIAPYYNRALSRPFFSFLLPVITDLFRDYSIKPPARVLEVACGPGHLCAFLRERRFKAVGADISLMQGATSPRRYAFPFLTARMQSLPLRGTFDVVLNMYDSLNHLMTTTDLLSTFKETRRVLKPGGLFIFDTNSRLAFKRIWGDSTPYSHKEDDFHLTMTTTYSPSTRLARAVVEVKTDGEEIISHFEERYFTRRDVRRALKDSGLHLLRHAPWCPSKEHYLNLPVKDLWIAVSR